MNILIVFIKNPVEGKVKTRLAARIGNRTALSVYEKLMSHTLNIIKDLPAEIRLYFSDEIMEISGFNERFVQHGDDLGERMKNAFGRCFQNKNEKVIIIGTDCAELRMDIISDAFQQLNNADVVIGPAMDGGYYLLGMRRFYPQLFDGISWSSSLVLDQTKKLLDDNNLSYTELIILRDIDTAEDLLSLPKDF